MFIKCEKKSGYGYIYVNHWKIKTIDPDLHSDGYFSANIVTDDNVEYYTNDKKVLELLDNDVEVFEG